MTGINPARMAGTMLAVVLTILGCAGPPHLREVTADPVPAAVGGKITFTARIDGARAGVASITGVPRGYSDYTISLNDEGRDGDEKAGDGIWSYSTSIPWDAPAGSYAIDFTARDKEGKPIAVNGVENGRLTLELVVK